MYKKVIITAIIAALFGVASLALAQEISNSDPVLQNGVFRSVYTVAITDNIDKADYVSPKNEEAGNYYFVKVDIPQIASSDLPIASLYGKEDPQNIRFGADAWENKNAMIYIKDGSLYILFAEKQDGLDPTFYLSQGVYKLVVIF